jgi:hypothetical protein
MTQSIDLETLKLLPNADAVFKQYSVREIESISNTIAKASSQIHADLQNLVSSKYRDLLKTSDLIIDMNDVSKAQDSELYQLSFLRNSKIDKLFAIEKNFDKFGESKVIKDDVDLYKNQKRILENNENFMRLSNFLNIDEGLNNNLEILEIINENIKFPILLNSWFYGQKKLIVDKMQNLENTIIINISSGFKIWEVLKVYSFWEQLKLFEDDENTVNVKKLEDEIFRNLMQLINNDFKNEFTYSNENLQLILKEFSGFSERILTEYINRIERIDITLNNSQVNEAKINLYELDFNDANYMRNVKDLNNGLHYPRYQKMNTNVLEFIKVLHILKHLDNDQYETNKNRVLSFINDFKQVAIEQENKLLSRYLKKLIDQVNA